MWLWSHGIYIYIKDNTLSNNYELHIIHYELYIYACEGFIDMCDKHKAHSPRYLLKEV